MGTPSNDKTLPPWFFPVTAAVNLFADAVILFAVIIHLDFVHASDALFRFVAFGFSIVEFVAAVLLLGVTVFTGIIRSKFRVPSGITFGTFIYHSVVMVATVFIQYFYDMSYLAFPYQILAVIPVITTVLSLLFLFLDWHSGKPELTKHSSESGSGKPKATFSAVTESTYSDYIDDLSPAPRPSARSKVQDAYRKVRKKKPAFRARSLKLNSSAKAETKPPIDKSRDYSNDVQDLFSETDPAFRQGGTILDSILGDPPEEEKKKAPKQDKKSKSYMEEFPDIPDEDKKGSVFEKHSQSGKLSSQDASTALKNHKM